LSLVIGAIILGASREYFTIVLLEDSTCGFGRLPMFYLSKEKKYGFLACDYVKCGAKPDFSEIKDKLSKSD
jgi:hypothetical protein